MIRSADWVSDPRAEHFPSIDTYPASAGYVRFSGPTTRGFLTGRLA